MLAPVEESTMLKSFFPSLFHIASVKVAGSLVGDFDYSTLMCAFEEILPRNSTFTDEIEDNDMRRAKQRLLFIPPHLRMGVWKALMRLRISYTSIFKEHSDVSMEDCVPCARSDGTIDSIKVAQNLVINKNIDIRRRFKIACNYCLENNIQVLWSEMEVSGQTKFFKRDDHSMVGFWSNRMRCGSQIPWPRAVLGFIESTGNRVNPVPKFSSFFPLLQPEDRQNCSNYVRFMELDDFRFCLFAMTKEEQEKVMERHACRVLFLYLHYPLQDLFLETVEKMWKYLDLDGFYKIVDFFVTILLNVSNYDYSKIFAAFWQGSPNHFREMAMESSHLRGKIDSFFNEMKSNRKVTTICVL